MPPGGTTGDTTARRRRTGAPRTAGPLSHPDPSGLAAHPNRGPAREPQTTRRRPNAATPGRDTTAASTGAVRAPGGRWGPIVLGGGPGSTPGAPSPYGAGSARLTREESLVVVAGRSAARKGPLAALGGAGAPPLHSAARPAGRQGAGGNPPDPPGSSGPADVVRTNDGAEPARKSGRRIRRAARGPGPGIGVMPAPEPGGLLTVPRQARLPRHE